MEEAKQTDHALTAVVITITGMVFILDLLTPSVIVIWALYLIPLGLTRWSSLGHLTLTITGICTVLIILAHLYAPPGASPDVAMVNRGLGVVNVWTAAFFLKFGRI